MHKLLFFESSRKTFKQVTDLYDFIWPTVTAMWNLRWQVAGYKHVNPSCTEEELTNRFITGSGIHGASLTKACIKDTWEKQREIFAQFLLIEVCALFEGWLEDVLIKISKNEKSNLKNLQFPSTNKAGLSFALNNIRQSRSRLVEQCFYLELLRNKKNNIQKIENLLICYRYFKECRNAHMHQGGIANQNMENAYNRFTVLTPSDITASEIPKHYPIKNMHVVKLSLRGVVGLSDVILKLIATLDAELSLAESAEIEFDERWLLVNGRRFSLKSNVENRNKQVSRLTKKLGYPKPADIEYLIRYLIKRRFIT